MSTRAPSPGQDTSAVYAAAGFTGGFHLGKTPAVVVVDFCLGFTDPACPLGADLGPAVESTRQVLDAARDQGVPVVFTVIGFDPGAMAASTWVRKVPSLRELALGSRWVEVDPRLRRRESETVVVKTGASAFFGTALHSMLTAQGVDTVLVAGATTSGCVRATVVDAVQYGFSPFVLTDCVGDRSRPAHEANIFDMTAKYADALEAKEAVNYLRRLSE
jgi:nicotinamidase-related amidase